MRHVITLGSFVLAFGLTLALGVASPALAATATSNMSVTATVTANCTISAGTLAFGRYDPVAATQVDGTAILTVTCTSGTTGTITLGQGLNPAGGSTDAVPLRRMNNGVSSFLSYALFRDSGRTTVWGNTAATGVSHTGTGASVPITVFGRVTAGQTTVPAGNYTDTVVATITL
jgi:spore coat protein U-like protein